MKNKHGVEVNENFLNEVTEQSNKAIQLRNELLLKDDGRWDYLDEMTNAERTVDYLYHMGSKHIDIKEGVSFESETEETIIISFNDYNLHTMDADFNKVIEWLEQNQLMD